MLRTTWGHIVVAIERATSYLQDVDNVTALQQNQQIQDAVVRNIEIIGEAANNIQKMAPAFVTDHPQIPWMEMRRMRNKVIHNYFDVDLNVVWNTVKTDLPQLKQQIESLLQKQRE